MNYCRQDIVLSALGLACQLLRVDGLITVRRGLLFSKAKEQDQNSDAESEE